MQIVNAFRADSCERIRLLIFWAQELLSTATVCKSCSNR